MEWPSGPVEAVLFYSCMGMQTVMVGDVVGSSTFELSSLRSVVVSAPEGFRGLSPGSSHRHSLVSYNNFVMHTADVNKCLSRNTYLL